MPHTEGITSNFYGLLAKPYGTPAASTGSAIAIALNASPFIAAYPWTDQVGFGTKFADPGTAIAGSAKGIVFTPDSQEIIVAHTTTPFVSAYAWSAAGFGTKFADPATLPTGDAEDVALRNLASATLFHIGVAHAVSPFLSVYTFSKTGAGWVGKFGDPATLPGGNGNAITFSDNGVNVALSHAVSPFTSAYPWSGSGFGTKYAAPATIPLEVSGSGFGGIKFSPLGGGALTLAQTQNSSGTGSPLVIAWGFNSGSGYGTKYTDPLYPPGSPTGSVPSRRVRFPKNGAAIMMGQAIGAVMGSPMGWRWDAASGFGNRYTLNLPITTVQVNAVQWNDSVTSVFAGHSTASPFMFARRWSTATGLGTLYSNPGSLPGSDGNDVAVAA